MSFKTASAILRGRWLIEPAYAKAQLPIVVQMIKNSFEPMIAAGDGNDHAAMFKARLEYQPEINLPKRRHITSVKSPVMSVSPYTSMDRLPYDSIAMVDIIGPVLKYGDICSYGMVEYNELMVRLANSERVRGIILNVDSPGGQADGTGMLAGTIKKVTKVKPVVSIIQDGYAASAGYWLGSSAQELYLTKATSSVGSIGAYTTLYDFQGFFEANGIILHEIYAPQSTDKNKDYKDALKGDYSLIEADLKFLVEDFVADVKNSRGARLREDKENPFTGKMYFAKDATKIGLADGIKSIEEVVKRTEQLISLRA